MEDMYIDGFATALRAFDEVLDEFAQRNRRADYGWARCREPLADGNRYSLSRVIPSRPSCQCCNDARETKARESKVPFENVLDDVQQVIFNDPATIVTFSDGSKVCVKACAKDTFNKETGLIYALVKRLYADDVDEKTGYLKATGLGEKIAKIIRKAVDQKESERVRRREQKNAKKLAAKKADAEKAATQKADVKKIDAKKLDKPTKKTHPKRGED